MQFKRLNGSNILVEPNIRSLLVIEGIWMGVLLSCQGLAFEVFGILLYK